MDTDNLLPLKVNRATLQKYNIIKAVYKKLVRKAIEMLRNLAEKDELKKEKDDDIDKNAKEVEINENREIVYMDNGRPLRCCAI